MAEKTLFEKIAEFQAKGQYHIYFYPYDKNKHEVDFSAAPPGLLQLFQQMNFNAHYGLHIQRISNKIVALDPSVMQTMSEVSDFWSRVIIRGQNNQQTFIAGVVKYADPNEPINAAAAGWNSEDLSPDFRAAFVKINQSHYDALMPDEKKAVLIHEMIHALGFSNTKNTAFSNQFNANTNYFVGEKATAYFNDTFGLFFDGVPIYRKDSSHLDPVFFDTGGAGHGAMMLPTAGKVGKLSAVTLGILQDIGYEINPAIFNLEHGYLFSVDKTDTDGDGLYDFLEKNLGSDSNKKDTDGDGVSDFDEVNNAYNRGRVNYDDKGVLQRGIKSQVWLDPTIRKYDGFQEYKPLLGKVPSKLFYTEGKYSLADILPDQVMSQLEKSKGKSVRITLFDAPFDISNQLYEAAIVSKQNGNIVFNLKLTPGIHSLLLSNMMTIASQKQGSLQMKVEWLNQFSKWLNPSYREEQNLTLQYATAAPSKQDSYELTDALQSILTFIQHSPDKISAQQTLYLTIDSLLKGELLSGSAAATAQLSMDMSKIDLSGTNKLEFSSYKQLLDALLADSDLLNTAISEVNLKLVELQRAGKVTLSDENHLKLFSERLANELGNNEDFNQKTSLNWGSVLTGYTGEKNSLSAKLINMASELKMLNSTFSLIKNQLATLNDGNQTKMVDIQELYPILRAIYFYENVNGLSESNSVYQQITDLLTADQLESLQNVSKLKFSSDRNGFVFDEEANFNYFVSNISAQSADVFYDHFNKMDQSTIHTLINSSKLNDIVGKITDMYNGQSIYTALTSLNPIKQLVAILMSDDPAAVKNKAAIIDNIIKNELNVSSTQELIALIQKYATNVANALAKSNGDLTYQSILPLIEIAYFKKHLTQLSDRLLHATQFTEEGDNTTWLGVYDNSKDPGQTKYAIHANNQSANQAIQINFSNRSTVNFDFADKLDLNVQAILDLKMNHQASHWQQLDALTQSFSDLFFLYYSDPDLSQFVHEIYYAWNERQAAYDHYVNQVPSFATQETLKKYVAGLNVATKMFSEYLDSPLWNDLFAKVDSQNKNDADKFREILSKVRDAFAEEGYRADTGNSLAKRDLQHDADPLVTIKEGDQPATLFSSHALSADLGLKSIKISKLMGDGLSELFLADNVSIPDELQLVALFHEYPHSGYLLQSKSGDAVSVDLYNQVLAQMNIVNTSDSPVTFNETVFLLFEYADGSFSGSSLSVVTAPVNDKAQLDLDLLDENVSVHQSLVKGNTQINLFNDVVNLFDPDYAGLAKMTFSIPIWQVKDGVAEKLIFNLGKDKDDHPYSDQVISFVTASRGEITVIDPNDDSAKNTSATLAYETRLNAQTQSYEIIFTPAQGASQFELLHFYHLIQGVNNNDNAKSGFGLNYVNTAAKPTAGERHFSIVVEDVAGTTQEVSSKSDPVETVIDIGGDRLEQVDALYKVALIGSGASLVPVASDLQQEVARRMTLAEQGADVPNLIESVLGRGATLADAAVESLPLVGLAWEMIKTSKNLVADFNGSASGEVAHTYATRSISEPVGYTYTEKSAAKKVFTQDAITSESDDPGNIKLAMLSIKGLNPHDQFALLFNSPDVTIDISQTEDDGENYYTVILASNYLHGGPASQFNAALSTLTYSNNQDQFDSLDREMSMVIIDEFNHAQVLHTNMHYRPINDAPELDFDMASASVDSHTVFVSGDTDTFLLTHVMSLSDKDDAGYQAITMRSRGIVDFKMTDGSPNELLKYVSGESKNSINIAKAASGRFALKVSPDESPIFIRYQTVQDGNDFVTKFTAENENGSTANLSAKNITLLLTHLKYANTSYNMNWDMDLNPVSPLNPTLGARTFTFTVTDHSGYEQAIAADKSSNSATAVVDVVAENTIRAMDDHFTVFADYIDPTKPYLLLDNDFGSNLKIARVILKDTTVTMTAANQVMWLDEAAGLQMQLSADGVVKLSLLASALGYARLPEGVTQDLHVNYELISGEIGHVTFTLVGVNDPPELIMQTNVNFSTPSGGSVNIGEAFMGMVNNHPAGISDPDSNGNDHIQQIRVEVTEGEGRISLSDATNKTGLFSHYSEDGKTFTLSFNQSVDGASELLKYLVYEAASYDEGMQTHAVISGKQSISVQVQDEQGAWSAPVTIDVQVNPVNVGFNANNQASISTDFVDQAFPNTIDGTSGNDMLTGKTEDEVIRGLAGDDYLQGGGGNDTLVGSDGHDYFLLSGYAELTNYLENGVAEVTTIADFNSADDTLVLNNMATQLLEKVVGVSADKVDDSIMKLVTGETISSADKKAKLQVVINHDANNESQLQYWVNGEAAHTVKFVGHEFNQADFASMVDNTSILFS